MKACSIAMHIQELTKLFGKERLSGKDGSATDLSFSEYLAAVEKQKREDIQAKMATARGY